MRDHFPTLKESNRSDPSRVGYRIDYSPEPWALPTAIEFIPCGEVPPASSFNGYKVIHQPNLQEQFGGIDIYLFDQLLKGRITSEMRVLDAGCGGGRNLVYFFRSSFNVSGVDQSSEAIAEIRSLAAQLAPHLPEDNFRVAAIDQIPFGDETFDVVISSAVLHFARDEAHWHSMVGEMWRVLKAGGIFFARLASTIGMEDEVKQIAGRRYHLPDGSDRFLVDEQMLLAVTKSLRGEWLEPLKTIVVQNMRSMSNWILRKP